MADFPVKRWQYGLTADEWFHIACEGENSEVPPCCGNIGAIRDLVRELLIFQAPEESGWRKSAGTELLQTLTADEDGHDLSDREKFPLFNRMVDGIREESGQSS